MNIAFAFVVLCLIANIACQSQHTIRDRMEQVAKTPRVFPDDLRQLMEARGAKNVRQTLERRKQGLDRLKKYSNVNKKTPLDFEQRRAVVRAMFPQNVIANKHSIIATNAASLDYLYEGDITLTDNQIDTLERQFEGRYKRSAPLTEPFITKWDKKKPIGYTFHEWFPESSRPIVRRSVAALIKDTCINITESNNLEQTIVIQPANGCNSALGKIPGNIINLHPIYCMDEGIIQHEFMHALGIMHTQSRHDRDNYVTVDLSTVPNNMRHNFNKLAESTNNNFGMTYDYESVMHYGVYDFSYDYSPVIVASDPQFTYSMGQRKYLTYQDLKSINILYKCEESCSSKLNCENGGYQNPKDCSSCICSAFYGGKYCENILERHIFTNDMAIGSKQTITYDIRWPGAENEEKAAKALEKWSDHTVQPVYVQAPKGRRLRVRIANLLEMPCHENCYYGGITVVDSIDGLLNGPGKTFCCASHNNTEIISKNNIVGVKGIFPNFKRHLFQLYFELI